MKIHSAYYAPGRGEILIQHNSGLVVINLPSVKKIPRQYQAAAGRLPPKRECPHCQGFGEVGMSGDRCQKCAGMGYTRT